MWKYGYMDVYMFAWICSCVPHLSDSGFTTEILQITLDRCEYMDIYMLRWIHGYIHVDVDINLGFTIEILGKTLDRWLHMDIYMFTWIHGYSYVPVHTWIYAYSRGCVPVCRIHGYAHVHVDIYLFAAYAVCT